MGNTGTATATSGAYVNLMLSEDQDIGSDDYFVIYEEIPFDLSPGDAAVRDGSNSLLFFFPDNIPNGTFYMALWVDDLDSVQESDESDNVSYGENRVTIEDTHRSCRR